MLIWKSSGEVLLRGIDPRIQCSQLHPAATFDPPIVGGSILPDWKHVGNFDMKWPEDCDVAWHIFMRRGSVINR